MLVCSELKFVPLKKIWRTKPHYLWIWPYLETGLHEWYHVGMRSYWIRVALNPIDVLIRRPCEDKTQINTVWYFITAALGNLYIGLQHQRVWTKDTSSRFQVKMADWIYTSLFIPSWNLNKTIEKGYFKTGINPKG